MKGKKESVGKILGSVILCLSLCFSICIVGVNSTYYASPPGREKGEILRLGHITLEDAKLALEAALGIKVLVGEQLWAADITGDGNVTLDEAEMILRAALGIEAIPSGTENSGGEDDSMITYPPTITESPSETETAPPTEVMPPTVTSEPLVSAVPDVTGGAIKAAVTNDLTFSADTNGKLYCAGELFEMSVSVKNNGGISIPFRVETGSYGDSGCMKVSIIDEDGKQCGIDVTHENVTADMYFGFLAPDELIAAERLMYIDTALDEGKKYYAKIIFGYDLSADMDSDGESYEVLIPIELDTVTTIQDVMEDSFAFNAVINEARFVSGETMQVDISIKNGSEKEIPICGEFAFVNEGEMACVSCSLQDESGNMIGKDVSNIKLEFWPYEGLIEPGELIYGSRIIDISAVKEPGTYYLNVVLSYGKLSWIVGYEPTHLFEVRVPLDIVF